VDPVDAELSAEERALLDRIAVLRDRVSVEELGGGLTNRNLKVTVPGAAYVVRLTHSDAGLLGIDRAAEHANSVCAWHAGAAPEVIDYLPDAPALVIRFVEGATLVDASFGDPGVMQRAAKAIRRLHAGPRFAGDFDMFARQASYLRTVREHGFWIPAGYDDHAAWWSQVQTVVRATARATVPCNNDLLAGNFIDSGERVWLIDYEYSGNNDPCFELGNTTTECDFTEDMIDAWCEAYFGDPTPADRARVRVQALCSQYGWALWGFIQEATSPLDFDFHSWGMERYEKAAATFFGGGLPRLLEQVASADG
jgi:thiamine kinase-like enzyme